MAGERIMEALDLADTERATFKEYEEATAKLSETDPMKLQPPTRNPVLAAYDLDPETYVLHVVEKVQSAALHDALLVLPFGKVVSLMYYLTAWAEKVASLQVLQNLEITFYFQGWNIPLVSRIMFFLLKVHHHQIVANRIMRMTLIPLRTHLRAALRRQKEMMGYNLAALQYMKRRNEAERTAQFYEEDWDEEKVRARIAEGKKRKRVVLSA
jgi:U3 small nucleolar RNA-associated protein 12